MPAARVRADYDALAQLAGMFQLEAEQTRRASDEIRGQVAALQNGDWVGQGAAAFYQEMSGTVLPSLTRLTAALENAAQTTARINLIMQQAEAEAARALNAPESTQKPTAADPAAISFGPGAAPFGAATPPAVAGGDFGANAIGKAVTAMQALLARLAERAKSVQAAYDQLDPDRTHNFQGAIDEAIRQYGLDPSAANGPATYDPDLRTRGVTHDDGTVHIGDGAFILSGRGLNISPGFLASTIGHELLHAAQLRDGRWVTDPDNEHLRQNNFMNEVEAYNWELEHAAENGLSEIERHAVETERQRFYEQLTPENQARVDRGVYVHAQP